MNGSRNELSRERGTGFNRVPPCKLAILTSLCYSLHITEEEEEEEEKPITPCICHF